MCDVVEDDLSERHVRSEIDGLSGPMEDLHVEIVMPQPRSQLDRGGHMRLPLRRTLATASVRQTGS
jgi:hypothetical protein